MKKIIALLLFFGLCLGLALPSYASLDEGLEVYYAFDAPFDNNKILDLSGNDRTGHIYGNVQQAEGVLGYAARFDGNGDYISWPTSGQGVNIGTGDFTVSFWFKTTDTDGYMLDARKGSDYEQGYYLISYNIPSERIYFGLDSTTGSSQAHSSSSMADDSWHMATGVRANTETILYIDGVEVSRDTTSSSIDVDSPRIYLGRRYTPSTNWNYHYYDGLIDDFRLYSRALSADEVQELYNMSQVPIPASIWLMAGGLFGLLGVRKRRK